MQHPERSVSIVITVYNEDPEHLAEAIVSARSQSVPPHEIIAVEDGPSRDYSALWARFPEVRVLRQSNAGPSAARNTGLAAATGTFVLFLDGDDRLTPNALAINLAAHAASPGAVMAFGGYRLMGPEGRPSYQPLNLPPEPDRYAALLKANCIGMLGTVLYRRAALEAVGGFDAELRGCEDWELYLRLARRGPILHSPEILAEYRQHGNSASGDRPMMLAHLRHMLDLQKPYVAGNRAWRSAIRQGWRNGRQFYARQQYADMLLALSGRTRPGRVTEGMLYFWIAMPFTMGRALIEEMIARLRRRRSSAVTSIVDRYTRDFLARYAGRREGRVLEIDAATPAGGPLAECDCAIVTNGGQESLSMALAGLRSGGVLLAAVPAERWRKGEAEALVAATCLPESIDINFYGNAATASAALAGTAAESFAGPELYALDENHPVLFTICARKK